VAIVWDDPPWQLVAEPALADPLDSTQLPDLSQAPPPQAVDPFVKLAQALLNAAGWTPPLTVDGKFGQLTHDAVIWHQARSLIVPTGTIDADTWLTLTASAPQPRLEPGPGSPPMATTAARSDVTSSRSRDRTPVSASLPTGLALASAWRSTMLTRPASA